MKYTIVGDPHLSKHTTGLVRQVCSQAEKLKNPVIWLGDMLNTKEVISGIGLNFWFEYFLNSPLNHTVLVGNHDFFSVDCEDHSLKTLGDLENVQIVDQHFNTDNLHFLPYIHTQEKTQKALAEIPDDAVLFAHLPVAGFDYGTGMIHREGTTAAELKRFRRTIFGHFHLHQKDLYLGSPYSQSFGETDQTKVIAVYDAVKDTLKLIKTNLPQHRTLEFNCDELAFFTGWDRPKLRKQDFYRVILTGSSENIANFPKKQLKGSHPSHISFLKRPTESAQSLKVSETDSPEIQFQQWGSEVRRMSEETLALGQEILRGVK